MNENYLEKLKENNLGLGCHLYKNNYMIGNRFLH